MQNSITVIGRLGADPVVGETESGSKYARFSIAVNRDYKDGEGNQITDWFQVTAWNRLAEVIGDWAKKGRQVCVSGPLYLTQVKSDKFKDQEGNYANLTYAQISADRVYFLDSASTAARQEVPLIEPNQKPSMTTVDAKDAGSKNKAKNAVANKGNENSLPFAD
jgi:single-strand DNA-binding protein